MTAIEPDAKLVNAAFRAVGRSFYGGIFENCKTAVMGKGHGNNLQPFDLETACYVKPILAAIEQNSTRMVVIMAGVKTLKSFIVEIAAAHHLCHSIGDVTIYFGSGEVALDQSTTRILAYFDGIPSYQEKRKTITGQWDATQSAIKFPDKTFRIKPANLANTQAVNLGFFGLEDAFVTERTGMIAQAIARTTQYPDDKKIILESQGGEEGFDFDTIYANDTDQRELHVLCPYCGEAQIFNWRGWHRERKADFVAVPPLNIPSLDREAWVAHNTPLLIANDRKHCGFKRGDNAKTEDGEYNEMEILRNTHYECFSCGSVWRDEPHIRTALDRSSFYIPAKKATNPSNIGFNVSQWINTRLPWGEMMLSYLKALKVKRDFNNDERLKQWWQKTAGTTWNPNLARILRIQTQEKYDVKSDWPEEWRNHRCFIVDCQHELQHFWGSIWAVSKTGKSRQLWRGLIRGFEKIVELQKEWGVLDQFVFLDAGYMEEELTEECAKHGHWITWNGGKDWACWTLLVGSPQKDFSHKDDKNIRNRYPVSDPFYNWPKVRVDQHRVSVEKYYFSALQMGDMFARYRDGNGPETLFLPETDTGKLSWTDQINSCSKIHLVNNRTGEATEIWKAPTQNTPTHYFDCGRMFMCVLCLWGISGHQEFTPPTEVAAQSTP